MDFAPDREVAAGWVPDDSWGVRYCSLEVSREQDGDTPSFMRVGVSFLVLALGIGNGYGLLVWSR